jgi:hypothetical protein
MQSSAELASDDMLAGEGVSYEQRQKASKADFLDQREFHLSWSQLTPCVKLGNAVRVFTFSERIAMDPISLILTALISGAVKEATSQGVKDAYNGLKTLIHKKLVGKPTAEMALTQYQEDPNVWKAPFEKELKKAGIDQDTAIVEAAQRVMTLVQPQQASQGKFNTQIAGNVQGFAAGDYQQVHMSFGNTPQEK